MSKVKSAASLVICPGFPFTELAIDSMGPERRYADRKHPLNRNPAALRSVTGFVWAASGTLKYRYG